MTPDLETDLRLHDPLELLYWARIFGVTISALCASVEKAGPRVLDIARDLQVVPDLPKARERPALSPYLLSRFSADG